MILYDVFDKMKHGYSLNYALLLAKFFSMLQLPTQQNPLLRQFSHTFSHTERNNV